MGHFIAKIGLIWTLLEEHYLQSSIRTFSNVHEFFYSPNSYPDTFVSLIKMNTLICTICKSHRKSTFFIRHPHKFVLFKEHRDRNLQNSFYQKMAWSFWIFHALFRQKDQPP